jgi:hypothetical protein
VLYLRSEGREKDLIIVKRRRFHVQNREFYHDLRTSPEKAFSAARSTLTTYQEPYVFLSTPEFGLGYQEKYIKVLWEVRFLLLLLLYRQDWSFCFQPSCFVAQSSDVHESSRCHAPAGLLQQPKGLAPHDSGRNAVTVGFTTPTQTSPIKTEKRRESSLLSPPVSRRPHRNAEHPNSSQHQNQKHHAFAAHRVSHLC